MFTSVCFVSQATFEHHIQPSSDVVVVSITDPNERPAKVRPGFRGVLRLAFVDVYEEALGLVAGDLPDLHPRHDHGVRLFFRDEELCDANDARRVCGFLKHHSDSKERLQLVVHCYAGISRSAAVALFAADRYGIPIEQPNPDTSCANARFLRLLNKIDRSDDLDVREVPEGIKAGLRQFASQTSLGGVF